MSAPTDSTPPNIPGRHVWRAPVDGEPLEEGGVCTSCGRYASEAAQPCTPHPARALLELAELDPGIRETVSRLRAAGFETTDSGDGRTKLAAGWPVDEVIAHPHVAIAATAETMFAETRRLCEFLAAAGVSPGPLAPDGAAVAIQATYDPADDSAIIMLSGLDDRGWP